MVISRFGGPEVLELQERPSPVCGASELRVRVRATAVNRADIVQRRGFYPAPPGVPQDIPGLEFAGEVIEVGSEAAGWGRGDRVFGLVGGGSYAEEVVVDARTVARIPERLGFVEAAAIPEAFITAWDALVTQGRLAAGQVALIHAVGSGVGTAAAQIARALGAHAIGTSRTRAKLERATPLGLDHALLVDDGRFADAVSAATDGRGADVVLELVGGAYLAEDVACTATLGRILLVGLVAGITAELDLRTVLRKRISIIGTALRSRPLDEKIAIGEVLARDIVPRLAGGELVPVVDRVLPLDRAGLAHEVTEGNDPFGKIVLEV
jgi:putative PIG3 family NAD(P)H quinone oxidoreductase